MIEKTVVDTARRTAKGAETLMKKAWSVMDAAAEKKQASQYLSDAGIRAVQGKGG